MELKITDFQAPGKISFNYEELKQQIQTRAADYASLVYTDDQIANAKKDRADLNRLKKALNDERIRQEKEFLQPFNEFKAQIKELCGIIDKATASVDKQIKDFEEQKKAEKLQQIQDFFNSKTFPGNFDGLSFKQLFDPKWLNASVSMKSIEAEMDKHLLRVQKDLGTLDSMGIGYEAMQKYQATLDLNAAIAEDARIKAQAEAKAKWEAEHAQMQIQEEKPPVLTNINDSEDIENAAPVEPVRQWVSFQALLSADEAKALGAWLRINGIRYKAI